MDEIERNALKFKRSILLRNLRETLAGLFVAVFFIKMGFNQHSLFETLACFELALSGLFIAFYINSQSWKTLTRNKSTDLLDTKVHYKKALLRQMKLLRSMRYWYVFPIATGFIALQTYGLVQAFHEEKSIIAQTLLIAAMILMSVIIIHINENITLKKLEKRLSDLS